MPHVFVCFSVCLQVSVSHQSEATKWIFSTTTSRTPSSSRVTGKWSSFYTSTSRSILATCCTVNKSNSKQIKLQTNQNKLLLESIVCIEYFDFYSMPFCLGRRNMLMFSSTQKLVKSPPILANTNTCMIEMISMLNRL